MLPTFGRYAACGAFWIEFKPHRGQMWVAGQSIADLMEMVKSDSSGWINENRISIEYFNWQRGYSAFSISKSQVDSVIHYILTQEEHHRKKTFLEEYRELLDEFGIEYDERYLFKDPE